MKKEMSYILLLLLAVNISLPAQKAILHPAATARLFAEKPFVITGMLMGYKPATDSSRYVKIIYYHIYKEQQNLLANIDAEGRFSVTFPLHRSQEINLDFGHGYTRLYGVPGDSLFVNVNLDSFKAYRRLPSRLRGLTKKPVTFRGANARINEELNAFEPVYILWKNKTPRQLIDSLDQMSYKHYLMQQRQLMLDTLDAFNARRQTSPAFSTLMRMKIDYSTAANLMQYAWRHNPNRKRRVDADWPVALTREYLNFLQHIPVNNPLAVNTIEYNIFLHSYRFVFTSRLESWGRNSDDTLRLINYYKEKGIKVTAAEERLVKQYLLTHNPKLKPLVDSFFEKRKKVNHDYDSQYTTFYMLMDSINRNLAAGPGKDILTATLIAEVLKDNGIPYVDGELKRRISFVTDMDLRNSLVRYNEDVKNSVAVITPKDVVMRSALQASQDKLFEELIKPYKGKVVYIDFWAPWCGPCKDEMKYAKSVKTEVRNKDVVFLYIGIWCTKEAWQNAIQAKGLEGQHYYASDDEGKLLSNKFGITGIPYFLLVDKQGKIVNGKAPRPSDSLTLLQRINELLNK